MGYILKTPLSSWTPVIAGSSTPGAGTYTVQSGWYVRIGNMIFVQAHVEWSAHTGTGDMTLEGLPFAVSNTANYDPEGLVNTANVTLPSGNPVTVYAHTSPNSTVATFQTVQSAGANTPVAMDGTGTLHINLTYSA